MHDLIRRVFLPAFANPYLSRGDDAARLETPGERLAFTTDSFVVKPIFFPGGDIGRLAICGTVNDLAMVGARPLYLAAAFMVEEGFPIADLTRIVESMRLAAHEADVALVAGDTKVVERGSIDEIFIATAGLGAVPNGIDISGTNARVGDKVILSGPIGDHGIAVLSRREGLGFESAVMSDCAPLNGLVAAMLEASRDIHCLRDPTRGGLATTLNELARQSGVGIRINEAQVPIREEVRAACELLGYDPLYVANEGKLVAVVAPEAAPAVLEAMQRHRYGREAAIIGEVVAEPVGRVFMTTRVGGTRIVDMLAGELLPRIC